MVDFTDWRVQRYLEWLCTVPDDRDPPTQKAFGELMGWHANKAKDLKNDPDFQIAWEALYRKTIGSPEKAQLVVTRLYETATDRTDPRQVPAARAWLEAVDAIKPRKMEVTVSKPVKDLSDDELAKLLAEEANREMGRRGG